MALKRSLLLTFLEIPKGAKPTGDASATENAEWVLCGDGFSELSQSNNAQTKDTQYINMDIGSTTVTGYIGSLVMEYIYMNDWVTLLYSRN